MAEIKVLKIGSDGFNIEHDSANDDLTFNNFTAGTQVSVTNGVTITSDIAFNALDDTIAGIENQNLLDKTATETITGDYTIATGHTLTLIDDPASDTDAVNKAYVDALVSGVDWQDSVLDKDLNEAPGAPSTGDRYIIADNVPTGDDWFGKEEFIAEWNGTAWAFTQPAEGFAVYVEDEQVMYVYNDAYDAGEWVKFSSVTNHNNLSGLQGGTANEFYHMTAAEDTWLATVTADITAGNVADLSDNETVTGDWTFSGTSDFNGEVNIADGDLVLPDSTMAAPVEGSIYWDGTNDKLYVYDGANYIDMTATGDAERIVDTWTAGEAIAQFDAVYISGNDTVSKADADDIGTAKTIGIAIAAIANSAEGQICRNGAVVNAINGLGASAGAPIFLSTTSGGLSTSIPTGAGDVVIIVGWAKNATDLLVDIGTIRRRAA